jgi:GntR family transcriptional regulator
VIAEALMTSSEMLHVVRLRRERRTGEPLMITEAWLPVELAGALTESALRHSPLYQLLTEAEVTVQRMQHEITAEIAGPRNARLLDTVIGAPLLRVNRLAFVAGGPHHYLSILLSPSRSRLLMNQTATELDDGDGLAIAHDVRRQPN